MPQELMPEENSSEKIESEELAVDSPENQTALDSKQGDALLELLLQKIETKSSTVAEAVRLAAIPYHFDSEILRALRGADDGLEAKIIERLITFSFVEQRNNFFTLSREMRDLLLQQWQNRSEDFVAANRRLLDFFRHRLQHIERNQPSNLETPTSDSVKQSGSVKQAIPAAPTSSAPVSAPVLAPALDGTALVQRDTLNVSILYHTLAVDGEAGLALLEDLMDEAEAGYRLAAAEQLVMTAESQRALLASGQQLYLDYQRARLDQLHRRWQLSRNRFEAILEQGDKVPPDLLARVRRDLGRSLAEQGNFVAAVEMQKRALVSFESQQNSREIGHTMNALGETHLGLALNAWGGGEPFSADSNLLFRWSQRIFEPAVILLRLPMLIYFASRLGWRTVVDSIFTIGIGVDWVVARLFAEAARWFERSQKRFDPADPGLAQVEENLGELHLSLKNPSAAIQSWRTLLAANGAQMDAYRQARAQLGLANALMQCGNFDEASATLTQILPVFERYGHRRRLGQAQTLLAQCRLRQGERTTAIENYQVAMKTWQDDHNIVAATDVYHQLAAVDKQAADATGMALRTRRYLVRFQHPLLLLFQQAALIALVAVILFALFAGVRTESGTRVNSIPTLIQPISPSLEDELSPSVVVSFSQQLQPDLNASVLWWIILAALGGYLLLYTLIGLLYIRRMPLQSIQEGERSTLVVDDEAITQIITGKSSIRLRWDRIQTMITQDRFRFGVLGAIFSGTYLQGTDERGHSRLIKIKGVTSHYYALQQSIRQRLGKNTTFYNTGFSFVRNISGWILMVAVTVLVLFLLLAQFDALKPWLTRPILLGYGLSDLYPLTYLAIGVLLVWWFVAEPLRSHLILHPDSPWIWAGFGLGVVLALLSLIWLMPYEAVAERPDVVLSILALMFLIPTTGHFWWTHIPPPGVLNPAEEEQGEKEAAKIYEKSKHYLYPSLIRYAVAMVALLLTLALIWFGGREWLSFNAAVRGNFYRTEAESARTQYRLSEATTAYEKALTAYERSISLRMDAAVVNSKAAILNRMGRYRLAVESYRTASEMEPQQWIYKLNEGLAYEQWATEAITHEKKIEYYLDAIDIYSQLLNQENVRDPSFATGDTQLITSTIKLSLDEKDTDSLRLFRAGAYYALARQYKLIGDAASSASYYQQAYADYDWLINHAKASQAAYFTGRGYAAMYLQPANYVAATEDFQRALVLDPRAVPAYTGQTWSNYFQVSRFDSCLAAATAGIDAVTYVGHIQGAVDAISKAIEFQPTSGTHYRTRAQLRYLLRNCPGYDSVEIFRQAIDDYDKALRYRPSDAGWWYRQAMLRLALVGMIPDAAEKDALWLAAGQGFIKAAEINTAEAVYWLRLANVYFAQRNRGSANAASLADNAKELLATASAAGADSAIAAIASKNDASALARLFLAIGDTTRAIQAAQAGLRFDRSAANSLIQLGWWAYEADQYELSVRISTFAAQATPEIPRAYFNTGLAALAAGQAESARDWYERGLDVTAHLANAAVRKRWYDEAIADLGALRADPRNVRDEIVKMIEDAAKK